MNGDNWHMTWAKSDVQYTSMCDGYGQFKSPPGMYNSRLMVVEGGPRNVKFADMPGYPELIPAHQAPRYYNFGVIALDDSIFQFLSTWPTPLTERAAGLRFMGVKLIYSDNSGRTWRNQDGSSPVRWEEWKERSRDTTMLFYDEPQDAFSVLSVLQMGRNYSDNKDGYIYIYSPNGSIEGAMNELVMCRVRKGDMLNRRGYEYFGGMRSAGGARWTRSLEERAVVHTFPGGWVNKRLHPWAWTPSIAYNAALDVYMMVNWATAPGPAPDFEWFTKPSYLGFWVAPQPWGPWEQVYENMSWTPEGDTNARCYSPIIAPKWIAADGKSFWLVWTDFQQRLSTSELSRRHNEIDGLSKDEQVRALAMLDRENRPYYSFNIQRVDINTT